MCFETLLDKAGSTPDWTLLGHCYKTLMNNKSYIRFFGSLMLITLYSSTV